MSGIASEPSATNGLHAIRLDASVGQVSVNATYFRHYFQRGVSLDARGRNLALAMFALAICCSTGMSVIVGAWPVIPFAGFELALLWLAFRMVAKHENDFEQITVSDGSVSVRQLVRGVPLEVNFYRDWLRLQVKYRGSVQQLAFIYREQRVEVGLGLNAVEKANLSRCLMRWIRKLN